MKLFKPLAIRSMNLKNRIVMLPMQLGIGLHNRRARAYYLERAEGGAGAIIMSGTSVDLFLDDKAWGRPDGVVQFIEKMKSFTDEIRRTGAKIGIQLWHGNHLPAGSGAPIQTGAEMVAPSAVDGMRALTKDEIHLIINKFSMATVKARESGLDFVELHGAHGYLLCQFFSGADNKRTDEYGGDIYGRMRFGLEIVKTAREAVGDDYPIFYRIGADEKHAGGVTLRKSKLFAAELEKAGVDAIDVSIGRSTGQRSSPTKRARMGTFVHLAEGIRLNVNIPVIAVGRINTSEVAESILVQERADLVGIGRQLIIDPNWPVKVKEGREEDVVPCESCNTCFRPIRNSKWRPGDPICKVNERAGREIDMPI